MRKSARLPSTFTSAACQINRFLPQCTKLLTLVVSYKVRNSWLRNIVNLSVTLSFLGANVFLNVAYFVRKYKIGSALEKETEYYPQNFDIIRNDAKNHYIYIYIYIYKGNFGETWRQGNVIFQLGFCCRN